MFGELSLYLLCLSRACLGKIILWPAVKSGYEKAVCAYHIRHRRRESAGARRQLSRVVAARRVGLRCVPLAHARAGQLVALPDRGGEH